MGCCEEHSRLNMAVGWDAKAWGYHGDDGGIFAGVLTEETEEYEEGHTVGCGVNFEKGEIFFTKEGKLLGSHHSTTQKRISLTTPTSEAVLGNPGQVISIHQCRSDHDGGQNLGQVSQQQQHLARLHVQGLR